MDASAPVKTTRKRRSPRQEPKKVASRGRSALSKEEKQERARARAEEREKANNLKPALYIQYQGSEINQEELIERAKAAFHEKKKRTLITELTLYVKPEERAAYYVINGTETGKLEF